MTFNIQSWGRISSSGNNKVVTLPDGTYVGAPGVYTYISATDDIATIAAADYFSAVCVELNDGDTILAVGSDTSITLTVIGVNIDTKSVITAQSSAVGDVDGPNGATDNALARFNGATGKLIQNSVAILSDVGALSGLTQLNVDNLELNGNTLSSTDANGDINLTPDGTGSVLLKANPTQALGAATKQYVDAIAGGSWIDQTATPVTMTADFSYSANTAGLLTFNMPAASVFGAVYEIAGNGAGGWLLQMNAGQTVHFGSSSSSVAGSLASTNRYDKVSVLCTVANTTFVVISSIGNITVA